MKKATSLILILLSFLVNDAQRTLVAPVNHEKIYPEWVGGDRDFWGHGPLVKGTVTVQISEGKAQIIAVINLRLEETGGEATAAEINESRLIYSAPAGKQIKQIHFPSSLTSTFNYKLPRGGINRVSSTTTSNGPVNYLNVMGDTGGLDIGNNTTDDSYVSIYFRGFVVELEPLAAGIREVTLPKNIIANLVADKLKGTTGKLNTYGPRHGDSWFKARDSWLKFPSELRPDTMFFDQLQEIRILPRRYYYNDIRLSGIRGNANNQYVRLVISWESEGPELRGECVDDVGCMFGTPTVQLDNFNIQINVRPSVAGGTMTYDPNDIQVEFAYNFGADCGILSDLCKEIFKDPLQNALFNSRFMLARVLASDGIRAEISRALNAGILDAVKAFGRFPEATQIVDVRDAGTSLVVRSR